MGTWTDVDDRLPEEDGYYAVYRQWRVRDVKNHKEFTCSDVSVTWYSDLSGFGDDTVTHWMPLPEPPKQETCNQLDT